MKPEEPRLGGAWHFIDASAQFFGNGQTARDCLRRGSETSAYFDFSGRSNR